MTDAHSDAPVKKRLSREISPALKDFIDTAIVPALLKQYQSRGNISNMTLLERAQAGELLTPEELAELLKKDVKWVYEKRRPRCLSPIPAMPMGRGSRRFLWADVLAWLKQCATNDVTALAAKRNGKIKSRKKRPLTDRERREMLELSEVASVFIADVERDEDGTLLCAPPMSEKDDR